MFCIVNIVFYLIDFTFLGLWYCYGSWNTLQAIDRFSNSAFARGWCFAQTESQMVETKKRWGFLYVHRIITLSFIPWLFLSLLFFLLYHDYSIFCSLVSLFVSLSVCLLIWLTIYIFVCLSICLFVYFFCLSVLTWLIFCLLVCLFVSFSVCLLIWLSTYLFICCLPIYLFVYLCWFIYLLILFSFLLVIWSLLVKEYGPFSKILSFSRWRCLCGRCRWRRC